MTSTKWPSPELLEAMDRAAAAAGAELIEQVRNYPPVFNRPLSAEQKDYDREVDEGWAKPGSTRY